MWGLGTVKCIQPTLVGEEVVSMIRTCDHQVEKIATLLLYQGRAHPLKMGSPIQMAPTIVRVAEGQIYAASQLNLDINAQERILVYSFLLTKTATNGPMSHKILLLDKVQ